MEQPEPSFFSYSEEALSWLRTRDKKLGAAIDLIGSIRRQVTPDPFHALCNAIVGQQISTKAQITIWRRLQDSFTPFTPEKIANIAPEELQSCGISQRKALYISSIAKEAARGVLDLESLKTATDQEIYERLCRIKGIGLWTAEMVLIFSLQRPNILSKNDLAIQRGLCLLYRHRAITPALFTRYYRRYTPYASVASLYLWEIAGGALEKSS